MMDNKQRDIFRRLTYEAQAELATIKDTILPRAKEVASEMYSSSPAMGVKKIVEHAYKTAREEYLARAAK